SIFLLMAGCSKTQNKILSRHVGFLTPVFLANQFMLFTKHPTLLIFYFNGVIMLNHFKNEQIGNV
ncbi:MAG: hypothetical protein U9N83_01635, partial [Thermodesulfobacteriota bacterium]|nr:hypothetical protein [Thermodesulfobacteriota bacterium]